MLTEPAESDSELLIAFDWLSKMHSGEFSVAEQKKLADWRLEKLSHEQAWQKAQCVWQGMEGLRGRASLPGSIPLPEESHQHSPQVISNRTFSSCNYFPGLAFAGIALLAIFINVFYPPRMWQADYVTDKGEQRSIILSDGSKVTLNTASALAIYYDGTARRVELLQGEAFFEVAKQQNRPFIVSMHSMEVKAIGTAFAVHYDLPTTKIELVEGIVEIQDTLHLQQQKLIAGQIAKINSDRITVEIPQTPANMALWRDGILQFDAVPLSALLSEINRYRPGQLILLNPALADKRVSGIFRLHEIDNSVKQLANALPELQIISLTPYLTLFR